MCDRDRDDLALLAAGLLDEQAASELSDHARECPECAAQLERWRSVATAVRDDAAGIGSRLPTLEPVLDEVEAELKREQPARARPIGWASTERLRAVSGLALAAALAALLGGAIVASLVTRPAGDVTVRTWASWLPWEWPSGRDHQPAAAGAGVVTTPTVVTRAGMADSRDSRPSEARAAAVGVGDTAAGPRLTASPGPVRSYQSSERRQPDQVVVIVANGEGAADGGTTAGVGQPETLAEPAVPPSDPDREQPGAAESDPDEIARPRTNPTARPTREPNSDSPPAPTAGPTHEPTHRTPASTASSPTLLPPPHTPVPTRPPLVFAGLVTGPDGNGRAEVWVVAEIAPELGREQVGTFTDATGAYRLELPSVGPWIVHVESPAYCTQWHSGRASPYSADRLPAEPHGARSVDFALERQPDGVVAGTVLSPTGQPAERAMIVAVRADDSELEPVAVAFTYFDGSYELFLGPGEFMVGAAPSGSSWPSRWWEDAATAAGATVIALPDGDRLDGVDFTLP